MPPRLRTNTQSHTGREVNPRPYAFILAPGQIQWKSLQLTPRGVH
jgi:hypothetical protein